MSAPFESICKTPAAGTFHRRCSSSLPCFIFEWPAESSRMPERRQVPAALNFTSGVPGERTMGGLACCGEGDPDGRAVTSVTFLSGVFRLSAQMQRALQNGDGSLAGGNVF